MRKSSVAVVVVALALALPAFPAGAAKTKNPCKTLKTSEISAAFGGATVSAGQRSDAVPNTPLCRWEVSASTDLPEGGVYVSLITRGAKAGFDEIENDPLYEPVSGLKGALYSPDLHTVAVLKGNVALTVQGEFLNDDLSNVDVEDQVVQLAKKAVKRV